MKKLITLMSIIYISSLAISANASEGSAGKAFGAGVTCELNGKNQQLPRELCIQYGGKIILV
ncbi:hypothetical protein [Vibrio tapetis]|uniref:Secreted protein n=1 Tax=Vibrio tapetis subsp. tapetis TaxID=1671868 RepID=A0A2N8ZBM9_9VIBR|nr:hypothetical protein [Vibrio tapetis]SON49293.1 conserved exported protein of unknown function [Vibrio tapetis subsp. tapetis]